MTDRAKYWAAQLAAWERSGLTQAEYCRRRNIKAGSLAWWKRQLAGTPGRGGRGGSARWKAIAGQKGPAFVEVAMPEGVAGRSAKVSGIGSAQESGYEVAFPCGTSIRLPADFDIDRASQLISAVSQSC